MSGVTVDHDAGAVAEFTEMKYGKAEDWAIIREAYAPYKARLPDRILDHMQMLHGDRGGFMVDRLEHTLQTATRAFRDGRDEEYVVCALIHDIGDMLGPHNHADIAAAILKPFISDRNHWMVQHHGIFQGYYFFHLTGRDRDMRERFRGHPDFEYTADFCESYDQNSFDPNYDTMPLSAFEPMLRRVMSEPRQSIYSRPADT